MNWLHTWLGVLFSAVLFVIFWTGTLAVFDKEIDRWTMPASRVAAQPTMNADALAAAMARQFPDATTWSVETPTIREPAIEAYGGNTDGADFHAFLDPATGQSLGPPGSKGGTYFFYRYHFTLHISTFSLGLFICALAALVMMVLCVSGVIVHKKIIADFFTFRARSKPQRTALDAHNLSGVLALPFHFIISFSGIALFGMMYVPAAQSVIFKGNPEEANAGYYSRPAAGEKGGEMASIAAMVESAQEQWKGDAPKRIRLNHAGDANAYVELQRSSDRNIAYRYDSIWFDAYSGQQLFATEYTIATEVYHTIAGLHLLQFKHLLLRWLYFVAGLLGCVLIATGLMFWVESRRKKYARLKMRGIRIVEGMAVGSVTGVLIASLGFMIANRLLPVAAAGREAVEVWVFHLIWIATFAHAYLRIGTAWREQCWIIAAGCLGAVMLNGITTGDWLPVAIARGQFGVAGVDLFMLAGAAACAIAARKLGAGGSAKAAAQAQAALTD